MRRVDKVFNKVKRLKVRNGDILVFSVDPSSFAPDKFQAKVKTTMDGIAAELQAMGKTDVTLFVLGHDQDLSTISEADMNKNGWYRKGGEK